MKGQQFSQTISIKTHILDLTSKQLHQFNRQSLTGYKLGGRYLVGDFIDEGAYGELYKAEDLEEKMIVAVKMVNFYKIRQSDKNQKIKDKLVELFSKEYSIMMSLKSKSEHIVKIFDIYENQDLTIIIMEYCEGGTLFKQIHQNEKQMTQRHAIEVLKQLIRGLSVIHNHKIIHRDIKSENIMSHNGIYKIIDFGISKCADTFAHTQVGTKITMAPQVIKRMPYKYKADIWSLGMITLEMLTGKNPLERVCQEEYQKIFEIINSGKIQQQVTKLQISEDFKILLLKMLTVDPEERAGWQYILKCKIFQPSEILSEIYEPIFTLEDISSIDSEMNSIIFGGNHQQSFKKVKLTPTIVGKVSIERAKKQQRDKLFKKTNRIDQDYLKTLQYFLECKKTEWIMKQIIKPMQKNEVKQILSKNRRTYYRVMYLLSSRCYLNLSFMNQGISNSNIKSNQVHFSNLIKNVKKLWGQVKQKFQIYSKLLTENEQKNTQIFKIKVEKLINSDEYWTDRLYLEGVQINPDHRRTRSISQGNELKRITLKQIKYQSSSQIKGQLCNIGYTKQNQIKYTYDKYLVHLSDEIVRRIASELKLANNMRIYAKLNAVTLEELRGKRFSEYVEQIKRKVL